MAQSDRPPPEPISSAENGNNSNSSLWRRMIFGRDSTASGMPDPPPKEQNSQSGTSDSSRPGLIHRVSRKVVPGLPRAQTFKRQQSEVRTKLEPVQPTPAERRTVSVDRRHLTSHNGSLSHSNPRSSAPNLDNQSFDNEPTVPHIPSISVGPLTDDRVDGPEDLGPTFGKTEFPGEYRDGVVPGHIAEAMSNGDCHSMTTSQYDAMIHDELESTWILNLSMHFRDKSKREKFFVTFRERPTLWRRVTVSVDYRDAPENSLEMELAHIKYQRDKIAKIYDAIRESLMDIQFYPTVTNLKLQTTEGRLHVHVVEDVNEIIHYPRIRTIQHMRCNHVKERDIEFDSHISGFVYKVRVNDEVLIKKEIPGPDTVDEFLYEINALNRLRHSNHVIRFYGVIVDDNEEYVKGLLISHAEQGALIDIIYDQIHPLPWPTRQRWARQIIAGLSEIHEAGFVQGDFTLSNIVIDDEDNAKIIDINRRGCPVGWEPPEATPLIESSQRISMYIGVKSDLYQLGMVLWSLAMKEDEPEAHGRPLRIDPAVVEVPDWYRRVVDICLSEDPRGRMPALQLLSIFPDPEPESEVFDRPSISVDDGGTRQEYFLNPDAAANGHPRVRTVQPANDWSYVGSWGRSHSYVNSPNGHNEEPFFYPTRGRSPPSPLPSNPGEYDLAKGGSRTEAWASSTGSARSTSSASSAGAAEKADQAERADSSCQSLSRSGGKDRAVVIPHSIVNVEESMAARGNQTHKPEESQGLQLGEQVITLETNSALSEMNGIPKEFGGGTTDSVPLIDLAAVQAMQDTTKSSSTTGKTEPVGLEHTTTEQHGRGKSESLGHASTTETANTKEPSEDVARASAVDAAPTVGSQLREPVDTGVEPISEDKMKEIDQAGTADSKTTHQEDPAADHSAPEEQHRGLGGVLDDLKGVGSTYDESGHEAWHKSMNNDDIADLIDAEMAAETKNDDGIHDTTVMSSV